VSLAEDRLDLIAELDAAATLIYANDALGDALGTSTASLLGQRIESFLPPAVAARLHAQIATARPAPYEETLSLPRGQRAYRVTLYRRDRSVLVIAHDLTELRAGQLRHAKLWERVLTAQEDERRRIARELHDQAGSSLAAMLLTCHAMRDAASLVEARTAASRLAVELTSTLDDLSRLARGLHPVALDELGLAPALARSVTTVAAGNGLAVELSVDLGERRMPEAVEVALFRIAQEAVTNVIKHAHATTIDLRCGLDRDDVVLTIADDGQGFDASDADRFIGEGRLGLAGLRDRAALLGGSASIESAPGRGTTVVVRIPGNHG